MKEPGGPRVDVNKDGTDPHPPRVKSKAPIWPAEQTYLWRLIEHKINLGGINLQRTGLAAALGRLMDGGNKMSWLPQPFL